MSSETSFEKEIEHLTSKSNSFWADLRVPNRFDGMRDLALFRRDIWDLS